MALEMRNSVHNRTEYLNFEWSSNFALWYVAVDSPLMMFTLCVLAMMVYKYMTTDVTSLLHPHLFISMILMGVFNMVFFIFDSLTFRLPTTGLLTAWCASLEPNRAFVFIYIAQILSTYWSMFFTLLFCIVRLLIYVYPRNHKEITKHVMPIFSSVAFVIPFISPYFMYSAKGYCRQWENCFGFGAVFISYYDTWQGIRHDYFFTPVTALVPILIAVVNLAFGWQAIKHSENPNTRSKLFSGKEKCSLGSTNLAMTIPYIAHCVTTVVTTFIVQSWSPYAILIRTPLTDFAHLAVILYYWRSHVAFKGKQSSSVVQPGFSQTHTN